MSAGLPVENCFAVGDAHWISATSLFRRTLYRRQLQSFWTIVWWNRVIVGLSLLKW